MGGSAWGRRKVCDSLVRVWLFVRVSVVSMLLSLYGLRAAICVRLVIRHLHKCLNLVHYFSCLIRLLANCARRFLADYGAWRSCNRWAPGACWFQKHLRRWTGEARVGSTALYDWAFWAVKLVHSKSRHHPLTPVIQAKAVGLYLTLSHHQFFRVEDRFLQIKHLVLLGLALFFS